MPARFGGGPLDYQLLEEEDPNGFTRLSVLVSPRIRIDDEQRVIDSVLEALGRGSVAADLARALWTKVRACGDVQLTARSTGPPCCRRLGRTSAS